MRTKVVYSLFLSLIIAVIGACKGQDEIKKAQFFTNGKSLYTSTCGNCHGEKGEGLGNLYPPLTDTASIRMKRTSLACIVKYGIHEKLQIDNRIFDTEMPPNPKLSKQEIAYILTYVGNSFGNELGLISTEDVTLNLQNCSIGKQAN